MSTTSGTPDYTASPQQDVRTLINHQNLTLAAGAFVSAIFPVQQDSHLVVHFTSGFGANRMWRFSFQYYADAAGTVQMAQRQHTLQSGQTYDQIIPCLGAYVKVSLEHNVYPSAIYSMVVSVDSRGDVAGIWNKGKLLLLVTPINVAAGATVNTDLLPTVGGAGWFYWEWSGTNYTINLLSHSFGGNDTRLLFHTQATAPAIRQTKIVWPDGYCWLQIISGDAGAQFMHVMATME